MGRLLLAALAATLLASTASAQVHVQGYTRSDGTYVAPHYRSAPNNSVYDNYSTQGNVNPYTGSRGTVNPYGGSYGSGNYLGSRSNGSYGNNRLNGW